MSELQKAVADILVKATQAAEAAGKFAVEQLPDVAHQYVLYKGIFAIFWIVVSVAALIAVCFWFFAAKKAESKAGYLSSGNYWLLFGFGGGAAALTSAITLANSVETAILAFFAPKVLLIQWAAELVK